MKVKNLLVAAILATTLIAPSFDSFAKGGSSSSSSRSSSSSSRSSSPSYSSPRTSTPSNSTWSTPKPAAPKPAAPVTKPSNSTWSTPKPAAPKPAAPLPSTPKTNDTWGTSKPSTNTASPATTSPSVPKTAAQKAREADKQNSIKTGSTKINEAASIDKWKAANKDKYVNKYTAEPATKPAYIPQTYTAPNGGYSAPISYNQNYGGYGYMDALGTFILWDAMTDVAFQRNQVQSNPTYQVVEKTTVVETTKESGPNPILIGFVVIIVIGLSVGALMYVTSDKS